MTINRHNHLILGNTKLARRTIENALVGLMRHQPVDIARLQAGIGQDFADNAGKVCHSVAEDFLTFHAQMPDGLGRRWPAINIKQLILAAIRMQTVGKNTDVFDRALAFNGLHDDSPRTIPKQHTGPAVFPIKDTRKSLRPDDKRGFGLTVTDIHIRRRQRIDKARTNRLNIKGEPFDPKAILHLGGCGRECVVRGRGRNNDQIDVIRCDTGMFHRAFGSGKGKITGGLTFGCDVALTNARTGNNPFI